MSLNTLAAVDLGSNSFHMIVSRRSADQWEVIDKLREPVRLAAGLDDRNRLDPAACSRALDCLGRFGQRIRDIPQPAVRVVGTNTLRRTRKKSDFIEAAEAVLGHPIEIISGIEEARLIYLGVCHSLAQTSRRRLVIDIGGGSTELIVGEAYEPRHLESLYMGCVQMSQRFFADGLVSKSRLREAKTAALLELRPVAAEFRRRSWDSVTGASGTIKAVREVVIANGWSEQGISADSVRRLSKALVAAGNVNTAELAGLQEDRRPVFAGGVAVLAALFEGLKIERMQVSQGALREGLLYDLLGRIGHEDAREGAVRRLEQRYRIDTDHASRVAATALSLFAQAIKAWDLDQRARAWLAWAVRLHELGIAIAHSQYHHHGAYVLEHGDLTGFSYQDQAVLSVLVRCHRRKIETGILEALPQALGETITHLVVIMRLAVVVHRSRSAYALMDIAAEIQKQKLSLTLPPGWLDEHPMTRADLEVEQGYLEAIGVRLKFS